MNKTKMKISILSMSLLTMSFLVITNAFGAMTKSFPYVPVAKIQMIGTVPSLGTLIRSEERRVGKERSSRLCP